MNCSKLQDVSRRLAWGQEQDEEDTLRPLTSLLST